MSHADAAVESSHSAMSWSAIIGGACASLTVSLVLIVLASGLGLASVSPWGGGPAAATVTAATGIGLVVVQWLSSGLGGYITGRLRADWVGVHTHEVFFRDTAHGFLMWTVTALVGVSLAATATASLVGGGAHAAAGAAQLAATTPGYETDALFRGDKPDASSGPWRAEAGRIVANGVATGDIPQADRTYLAQLIATHAGVPQADAQHRVDDLVSREQAAVQKAKDAAEAARKAAAAMAIFTALSMMVGAFIASAAAAYGGGSRDKYRPHA